MLAERAERLPRKLPMGVRTELTMNTSLDLEPLPMLLAGQESLEHLRRVFTGLQPDLKKAILIKEQSLLDSQKVIRK